MNMSELFQNGSLWLRADFHLHTKADSEFKYGGKDFAVDYINKLIEEKIHVGVITNHNKFAKAEFVALKKKASENAIGLFPGVEFSLKEGVHILIVFDDEWYKGETDHINEFLNTAFYNIPNFSTPDYPNSVLDLGEAVKKLDEKGKNYFIILAHVDDTNGIFEVLKGRSLAAFVKQEAFDKVLALQKSGNLNNYKKICEYANRPGGIACIEGSDNAQEGLNGIGAAGRITYLKAGAFNFEMLQYSLLAHEDRIRRKESPKITNSHIRSISLQGGLLDGKKIYFSAELNNLIGIRGSGKSAILEILRYALNIPSGSQSVDKEYKDDLIKHVLQSGGKAVVEIVNKFGDVYMVERIYGEKETIYKGSRLQNDISLDAILRHPIYFGQKDLSNKNADFENDLLNKIIGNKLNDAHAKIDSQKKDIQRIVNELKSLQNLSQLKKDTETAKANAEYKIKAFKEKGIAEKLKQQTAFESDIDKIKNHKISIKNYMDDLRSIVQNHEYIGQPVSSQSNTEFFKRANELIKKLSKDFADIANIIRNTNDIYTAFGKIENELIAKKEEFKDEFAKIKRDINVPQLNPDEFIKTTRELEVAKLKLIEIDKSEIKRIELEKQLLESVNKLNNLWHDKFKLLQDEIANINAHNGKLKIDIIYKGRKDKFIDMLKQAFKGTRINEQAYNNIGQNYADFVDIYKDEYRKLSDILNENQLVEVKNRFQENLYNFLVFSVDNKIAINFDGKLLKEHSLGQRASALILFLLSQNENDILIIDQPEDDLDNQTIYEDVIKYIKRLKGGMQFIFATHNANIPVLGDSEMLVSCQYVPDKEIIIDSGSIDCRDMQSNVINIMEGGKEALKIRKQIYKIWES